MGKHVTETDEEEEASDEFLKSPVRRRAIKQRSKEQSEDDDSMLEELADVEHEKEVQSRRTRSRQDTLARKKRLEGLAKLRQRRAGVIEVSEVDENEEDDDIREGEDDDEENDNFDEEPASEGARPTKTLDDYDSDFVEDDGEIGVDLLRHSVPLRLTSHANKKPFDYFKDEVEWYVLLHHPSTIALIFASPTPET